MHPSTNMNELHRADGVNGKRSIGGVLACAAALANLQSHGKLPYIWCSKLNTLDWVGQTKNQKS